LDLVEAMADGCPDEGILNAGGVPKRQNDRSSSNRNSLSTNLLRIFCRSPAIIATTSCWQRMSSK
jgi:hypothetical protein